jgi:hypothetical protein
MCLGGSRFLQVCLSIRHDPDRSNHKRSLLRKKEGNNQDDDNFIKQVSVHNYPFATKKPPDVVGRLVLLYAGMFILLALLPSQPQSGP